MRTTLQHLIQSLDDRREALLDELDTLGAESLHAKPGPGAWSILEIAEHLVVAEKVILQELPTCTQLVDQRRSLQNRVAYLVVMGILRFAIPVKVPSRRMVPTGEISLPALRREWDEHLHWLRSYESSFDPDGQRRALFTHPVAGPITLVQALRMDLLHLRIHGRQIHRLRLQQDRKKA